MGRRAQGCWMLLLLGTGVSGCGAALPPPPPPPTPPNVIAGPTAATVTVDANLLRLTTTVTLVAPSTQSATFDAIRCCVHLVPGTPWTLCTARGTKSISKTLTAGTTEVVTQELRHKWVDPDAVTTVFEKSASVDVQALCEVRVTVSGGAPDWLPYTQETSFVRPNPLFVPIPGAAPACCALPGNGSPMAGDLGEGELAFDRDWTPGESVRRFRHGPRGLAAL